MRKMACLFVFGSFLAIILGFIDDGAQLIATCITMSSAGIVSAILSKNSKDK